MIRFGGARLINDILAGDDSDDESSEDSEYDDDGNRINKKDGAPNLSNFNV